MVDLDKFICSLLNHSLGILDPFSRIYDALAEQGLEYKDGAIKPIEKEGKPVIIDAGFGSLTVHFNEEEMEAFKEGLKKKPEAEKPSTIKFDEPDIDAMVEEYKKKTFETFDKAHSYYLAATYRQGLKDMYRKLKENQYEKNDRSTDCT